MILPSPPEPIGAYARGKLLRGIGMLSGQFPIIHGRLAIAGRLGDELSVAQGCEAARIAALNALAQIEVLLGGFDALEGLLRVEGIVASDETFLDHATVLDGASDVLNEVLGEKGVHARALFPVPRLPMNSPVEIVVSFAYRAPDGMRHHGQD